jgi:hypothetical protein
MSVQFQLRRDTAANWTSDNPTLAQGEPGFEKDTGKLKIGDGVTAWTGLSYVGGSFSLAVGDPVSGATDSSVLVTDSNGEVASGPATSAVVSGVSLPTAAGQIPLSRGTSDNTTTWGSAGGSIPGVPPAAGDNPFAQGSTDGVGTIAATSAGAFAQGYVNGAGSEITAAGSPGGFAQGSARDGGTVTSGGGFAQGCAGTGSVFAATVPGAFVQGYATNGGSVTATALGAFAQGVAEGAGSTFTAQKPGAFAQGYARLGGTISAGYGFAQGYANGGSITASYCGAFAQGYAASGSSITASYTSFALGSAKGGGTISSTRSGSFAQGYANTAETISATANNAVQFGPGTNAQANSLQVGNGGIRLLGKASAQPQTTFQNGDIWVGADGHVKVRSNGATVSL